MNYKKYSNDIGEFDPESQRLIRSSHSSSIALRSQKSGKYGGIQNTSVGKIQRGEKIRGMNNVSPLATVKFFNQTSDEIFRKYLPDGNDTTKGSTTVIKDAKVVTKDGYNFDAHDYFSDKNRDGKINPDEELAFKLLIFVSTDGNKVKECYEVVKPAADEIILFLETDEDGLSEQKLYGKISEKVRKTYVDTTTGKLYRTFFEGDIIDTVQKYLSQANKEIIEELLLRGYIEDKGIAAGFFSGLKYVLLATSAPAKALGWVMNKLGNGIDFLKISDEFWDTENENYYFQKEKLIENLSIPTDKLSPLKNIFTDKKGFNLADLTPQMLDDIILKQVSVVESFVGQYNSYVKTTVDELFKTMENPEIQIRVEILSEKIALICGIWNGLVDFVSSIFKFLGMLLEAPFNITKDFEQILEMIDNFWEMSRNGTLWDHLEKAISAGMVKMVEYLKSKNADNVNWVRINYVAGFTIAFVGTFFIPLANIAKVANAGKLGEIFVALNTKISETVIKTSNFAKKVENTAVYKNTSKALEELFEMFSKGGQKLQNFVDDVWKEIAEWFLKNKEKYQELARYGKTLLERTAKTYAKKYPDGKLYKILKVREAYKLYGNLGKKLVQEVDIAFENIIKLKGYKDKVMISGMLYKGDKTQKVFSAVNFTREERLLGKLAEFIESMHPVLKKRYELHLKEITKGLKATPEMIKKAGIAASHGEIRAVNDLLYYLESIGVKITDDIFKDIMGYNRYLIKEGSQPPCVHCFYLTDGVVYLKLLK